MLLSLCYASRPAVEVDPDVLLDIWEQSADNNERNEVTGALYFGGDFFFQTIEGDAADITDLYEKVRNDPRHTDVKCLVQNDIVSRMFQGWPMRLIDGSRFRTSARPFDYETLAEGRIRDINKASFWMARI